jgi:hypothetical protein
MPSLGTAREDSGSGLLLLHRRRSVSIDLLGRHIFDLVAMCQIWPNGSVDAAAAVAIELVFGRPND